MDREERREVDTLKQKVQEIKQPTPHKNKKKLLKNLK